MEEGAWYKVRGLRVVEKDEAPLCIWRRPSRESGSIRFSETSFTSGPLGSQHFVSSDRLETVHANQVF